MECKVGAFYSRVLIIGTCLKIKSLRNEKKSRNVFHYAPATLPNHDNVTYCSQASILMATNIP